MTPGKLPGGIIVRLLVFFIIAIPALYYWLGGFKPLKVELVAVDDYNLIGRNFEGGYRSDTLQIYFKEMKSYLQEGKFQGALALIYYQEPMGNRGFVKCFVGILTEVPVEDNERLSLNMDRAFYAASKAIRVSKDCHSSLMPNPHKIQEHIREKSAQLDVSLRPFNIELYYPDNRLIVENPLMP